jgi:hypothetical protein
MSDRNAGWLANDRSLQPGEAEHGQAQGGGTGEAHDEEQAERLGEIKDRHEIDSLLRVCYHYRRESSDSEVNRLRRS